MTRGEIEFNTLKRKTRSKNVIFRFLALFADTMPWMNMIHHRLYSDDDVVDDAVKQGNPLHVDMLFNVGFSQETAFDTICNRQRKIMFDAGYSESQKHEITCQNIHMG